MGKLIMVRHGRTVLNSLDDSERLRGWLEIPLDQQGLQEAAETAERIAQHPVERIYCSDLHRARQTAEAVVKATKAPIVHTSDLRPWNLGTLAGQRVVDILPVLKELEVDCTLAAPGGESFFQFYERYSRKLWELTQIATHSSKCIVAVTHARNLLTLPTILLDGDKTKVPVRGGPRTGALVWVEEHGEGFTYRVDEAPQVADADSIPDDLPVFSRE
jgi:probable phosphoglycerate mutase